MTSTQDSTDTNNSLEGQKSKRIPVIVLCLFLTFICADLFLHETFMLESCDLTSNMQSVLGNFGKVISDILSGPLSYWVVPFLFLLPCISDNYISTLHYYFLYFGQITIVILLKASYGRGRPTIIGKNVTAYKCSCDYGMPSGHSSSACMTFLILIDFFNRSVFQVQSMIGLRFVTSWLRTFFKYVCYTMIVAICWSRLYLGVHSFNQVIYGFMTSLTFYLFFDRETFKGLMRKVNTVVLKKIGFMLLFITPLIVYIYFFFMTRRTTPKLWKYWSRCP